MRHICTICGYVYDEAREPVPFAQLPEDWVCPRCGAGKGVFRAEGAEAPASAAPAAKAEAGAGLADPGVRAALCSSLGRGCEKQYDDESAALYRTMAAWLTAAAPVPEGGAAELAALLDEALASYPALEAAAKAAGDRGTRRVCVWGTKVLAAARSLLDRPVSEAPVWVCSVCGFVYAGDRPPERCPVCKVPEWKFDRVEGRAGA